MADSPTPPAAPIPAGPAGATPSGANPAAMDPRKVIRSPAYLSALVLAAILGIPISAVAYGFLALVTKIQHYLFVDLPTRWSAARPRPGGRCPGWCSVAC